MPQHSVYHRIASAAFAVICHGFALIAKSEPLEDLRAVQHVLAPGACGDAGCLQRTEGIAEHGAQFTAPDVTRRIDGDIDVGPVVAVEHDAGDQAPEIVLEADAAIWLDRRRLQLAHHPFDDGVICGRVVRQDDSQINPPGM